PIALSQFIRRQPAAALLVVEQIGLGAAEDFLPAQSVADDQHHGPSLARRQIGALYDARRRRTQTQDRGQRHLDESRRVFHYWVKPTAPAGHRPRGTTLP